MCCPMTFQFTLSQVPVLHSILVAEFPMFYLSPPLSLTGTYVDAFIL